MVLCVRHLDLRQLLPFIICIVGGWVRLRSAREVMLVRGSIDVRVSSINPWCQMVVSRSMGTTVILDKVPLIVAPTPTCYLDDDFVHFWGDGYEGVWCDADGIRGSDGSSNSYRSSTDDPCGWDPNEIRRLMLEQTFTERDAILHLKRRSFNIRIGYDLLTLLDPSGLKGFDCYVRSYLITIYLRSMSLRERRGEICELQDIDSGSGSVDISGFEYDDIDKLSCQYQVSRRKLASLSGMGTSVCFFLG